VVVRRLFRTGVVVAALAATLAGCDSEPTTAPVTESAPEQGGMSSLEGVFTADSIEEYLDIIAGQLLTPWFQDAWPDVAPPGVTFVPAGQSGADGCAFDDESLAYCAGDQTVYVGQTALWDRYSQAGDATTACPRVTSRRGTVPEPLQCLAWRRRGSGGPGRGAASTRWPSANASSCSDSS
jgi:hypothetical protein